MSAEPSTNPHRSNMTSLNHNYGTGAARTEQTSLCDYPFLNIVLAAILVSTSLLNIKSALLAPVENRLDMLEKSLHFCRTDGIVQQSAARRQVPSHLNWHDHRALKQDTGPYDQDISELATKRDHERTRLRNLTQLR
jgi:hypothetical protein